MEQEKPKSVMPKNSNSEEMEDLRKSAVEKVLNDDFDSKNSVNSALKMTSKCRKAYAKMNFASPMNTKDGAFNINLVDNIEVKMNFLKMDIKAKLKGNRFWKHHDFGVHKVQLPVCHMTYPLWVNPYFRFGASRSLSNPVFNIGSVISWCSAFSNRFQLNYDAKTASVDHSAFSFTQKVQWTHKNFWLDWLYTFNFAHRKQLDSRNIRGGWSDKTWSVNGEMNKKGHENTRAIDNFSLGIAYDGGSVGIFAARLKKYMDGKAMEYHVGASKKINDKTSAKLRMDNNNNVDLWGSYKIGNGHTFTGTLSTNLKDSDKVEGLFDFPVKFGIKYKIDK